MSLLLRFADAKDDNYRLYGNKLINIDNENVLANRIIQQKRGTHIIQAKDVLFLLGKLGINVYETGCDFTLTTYLLKLATNTQEDVAHIFCHFNKNQTPNLPIDRFRNLDYVLLQFYTMVSRHPQIDKLTNTFFYFSNLYF